MAKKILKLDVKGTLLTMRSGETMQFVTGGEGQEVNMYTLRSTATRVMQETGTKIIFRRLNDGVNTIAICL